MPADDRSAARTAPSAPTSGELLVLLGDAHARLMDARPYVYNRLCDHTARGDAWAVELAKHVLAGVDDAVEELSKALGGPEGPYRV